MSPPSIKVSAISGQGEKGKKGEGKGEGKGKGKGKGKGISLEGTYNNHLVQLPDHFRADQKIKHVIKGIVKMPLKH